MKNSVFIFTICCLCQLGLSQNFIGEIKYIISTPEFNIKDTITYYFDKDLVLVKNVEEAVEHGGSLYDIFILSENKLYSFNSQQNSWSEFIFDINTNPVKNQLDSIEKESVVGYDCEIYEYQTSFKNEYIESNANHILSISEKLLFNVPSNFSFDNYIFANGTGRIALKHKLSGTTISALGDRKKLGSILTAISITPTLSENYKEIINNFENWRRKR